MNIIAVFALLALAGCAAVQAPSAMPQLSQAQGQLRSAWRALENRDHLKAHAAADACVTLLGEQARAVNPRCPGTTGDCILLNVVGECLAVKVLAYRDQKDAEGSNEACRRIEQHYSNSGVYEYNGMSWTPLELCREIRS